MRLYVIRHGESANNQSGLWTGHIDSPLTEKGERDALRVRAILDGVSFDRVLSSDLCRASRTAELALPDHTPELTEALREIHIGALQGTKIADVSPEERVYYAKEGFAEIGGESRADFAARVRAFMASVATEEPVTVAAFCHGGVLCRILEETLSVEIPRRHLAHKNCAIGIFDYRNGIWQLYSWINHEE